MLRAAYFGQELLSTFSTNIGEIALIPATGGLFQVTLTYQPPSTAEAPVEVQEVLLWDRKSEGGFPETKILKQRVRDHIEPGRDLGHSDKKKHEAKSDGPEAPDVTGQATESSHTEPQKRDCEDCK